MTFLNQQQKTLSWYIEHEQKMKNKGYHPIVDLENRSILSLLNEIDETIDLNMNKQTENELLKIAELISMIRVRLGFPGSCFKHHELGI